MPELLRGQRAIWHVAVIAGLLMVASPPGGPVHAEAHPVGRTLQLAAEDAANVLDLATFFDETIPRQLADYGVPGAAVSVVEDGQQIFARGYGRAHVEHDRPVLAEQTVFRLGSVGKLATWTAVMQLAEQGRLDLHADVNVYLDGFQVPPSYARPITLAHLLTHTAGFEDRRFGLLAQTPEGLQSLAEYLPRNLPARVRPPGELAAYSNHGTALAGHIVERVSGVPFEQYADEHILGPLGMQRSTFRQPLPAPLIDDLAVGYRYINGAFRADPFEYFHIVPAGSLSGTVTDLSRFMIAHLQEGRYGQVRILEEAAAQEMHRHQFAHDPRLPGWTYGFKERRHGSQRVLWHGGDTGTFHGVLMLIPEQSIGLAAFYNGAASGPAYRDLMQAFLDRYYPVPSRPAVPAAALSYADRITGEYLGARSDYTRFLKLENLFRRARVSVNADDTLLTDGAGYEPGPRHWVQQEPLVFTELSGRDQLVFSVDESSGAVRLFVGSFPVWAFEKLAWYETVPVQTCWLAACVGVFLGTLGRLVGERLTRRWRSVPHVRPPRLTRWLAALMSGLNLLFIAAFGVWFFGFYDLPYDVPSAVRGLLVLPLVSMIMTIALCAMNMRAWTSRQGSLAARTGVAIIALSGLAYLAWLGHWNLLGFHF